MAVNNAKISLKITKQRLLEYRKKTAKLKINASQ